MDRIIMPDQNKLLSHLTDLLTACRESYNGYTIASRNVQNRPLEIIFQQYAVQRARFANQLLNLTRNMDVASDTGNERHPMDSVDQEWADLTSAIAEKDVSAILEGREQGEYETMGQYQQVLGSTRLPTEDKAVIHEQYREIQQTYHHIRKLQNSFIS